MLLETFTLAFGTEGLGKIAQEIQEAEQKVSSLEKEEKKLNETIKKGGKDSEDAIKRLETLNKELKEAKKHLQEVKGSIGGILLQLKEVAVVGGKFIGAFAVFRKATGYTDDFIQNVLNAADAAKKAKVSLDEYQKQTYGRTIFTKDDVKNAQEYEMVMRDIRAGTAQIGSNLAQLLLPAMTAIVKVTAKITNYFAEHGEFIKAVFVGIGVVITAFAIPSIINMGIALWGALSPVFVPISLIIGAILTLALIFEDFWKWMHGEPSVAELLFGDFDKAINNVISWWETLKTSMINGFNSIKNFLTPIFEPIIMYMESCFRLWISIFSFLGAKIIPILQAIGTMISNIINGIAAKLMPILNSIGAFFSWLFNIIKDIASTLMSGIIEKLQNLFKMGGVILKVGTAVNNIVADKLDGSHANGLDYVPFDGYIAELHKGERVQTADEASDWRSGLIAAQKAINFTAQYPLNSIPQGSVSTAYNTTSQPTTINIGDVTIQTQATDAEGIATDLASYIKQAVISLDDGMLA